MNVDSNFFINTLCIGNYTHKMIYSKVTGNPVFFVNTPNKIDLRRGSYLCKETLLELNREGTVEDIEFTLIDGTIVSLQQLCDAYKIVSQVGYTILDDFLMERLKDKTDIREYGFTTEEISIIQKATAKIICIASQVWGEGKLNPCTLELGKAFSTQAEFETYIETLNEERCESCDEEDEEDNDEVTTVE